MPTVDVVVFSHNHEQFVRDAMAGIFSQVTSADIRVRWLDDASDDSTVDIVKSIAQESPFEFILDQNPVNMYQGGSSFKYNYILESSSDFVAILDADDYWVDRHKISAQLEMLGRYSEATLCHTKFQMSGVHAGLEICSPPARFAKPVVPGRQLSWENFVGTLTVVLRRDACPEVLPPGFDRLRLVDDYPLWALITQGSSIAFLDRVTGVYRLHDKSNFSSKNQQQKEQRTIEAVQWISQSISSRESLWWKFGFYRLALKGFFRRVVSSLRTARSFGFRNP